MSWASFWASVVGIFNKVMALIPAALAYFAGQRAERAKMEAEQAKKDAELNAGYAEDLARRPEPGESTGGMRRGDWPT